MSNDLSQNIKNIEQDEKMSMDVAHASRAGHKNKKFVSNTKDWLHVDDRQSSKFLLMPPQRNQMTKTENKNSMMSMAHKKHDKIAM